MPAPPEGPVVFLLSRQTTHADFERLARSSGWVVHEERPSTGTNDAYEQVWVTSNQSAAIHYMDDPTPGKRFLVIYGRGAGEVAFDVGANLDIETSEDVLERALCASPGPEWIEAAWEIGVVTKVYDETALDLLESLYNEGDDSVRHAVINAVGYRGWPEARGFLERAATDDPKSELRENARDIIKAWWP